MANIRGSLETQSQLLWIRMLRTGHGDGQDTEMSKGHEVDLGARRPRSTSSDASGRRERKGSDASATSKKSAEEQEARVDSLFGIRTP